MREPKYINAEQFIAKYGDWYTEEGTETGFIGPVKDLVEQMPAADVVEVVRCKDCKHFEYNYPYIIQGIPVLGHEVCNAWGEGCKTNENGYCFMAERKSDE